MFFTPVTDPTAPGTMPGITFGAMIDSMLQNMMGRSVSKNTSFAREFDDYKPEIKRMVLAIAIAYNHYGDFYYGQPGGDPVDSATHDVVVDRIAITSGDLSFYNVQYSFHMVPKTGLEREAKNGLSMPQIRIIRMEDLPIVELSPVGFQCRSELVRQVFEKVENFPGRWGFNSDQDVTAEWFGPNGIKLTAIVQLVQSKPEAQIGKYENGMIEYILKEVTVESPKMYNEEDEPLNEKISIYEKVAVQFDEHGASGYVGELTDKLNRTFQQMFMNLENRMYILETNRFG